MATPTLVIGLGGSGLKTVTHIKKNLMEVNNNQLPGEVALLVLDTEKDIKYRAGGWGKERTREHATGPVKLDVGEYIALTGNAKPVGERIKAEQIKAEGNPSLRRNLPYRHISTWFQAQYYIDTLNISAQVWNLDEGAGRYRQFGRLALFSNIGLVTRKLKDAMGAIQRRTGGRTLYVHVVGSLAGGTGASMFADVAHLVNQIAVSTGYQQGTVLFGHFILTEAFSGTPQVQLREPGVKQNFNARMYAALRELARLQSPVIARSGGYPITYDPQGTAEMNASLKLSPYSAVYLYDGQAMRAQLNQLPLENGLAPAIADILTAYVDDLSGGSFRSHSVNSSALAPSYHLPAGAVTFGSVGVYTIELPIYHITEGWAHRLAREALVALLAPDPAATDAATHVPARLLGNQPGGKPRDAATDVREWVQNYTTAPVAKMVEWGQRVGRSEIIQRQTEDEILALTAESWQQDLAPSDPRLQDYVAEAQAELKGSLVDKDSAKYYVNAEPSGRTSEQRAANLQTDIDAKLRTMIGDSTEVWRRGGGDFRRALVRLANHHVNLFDAGLIARLRGDLNGSDVGTAVEQKSGKLGYVIAFLTELEGALATAAQTLTAADRRSHTTRRAEFDVLEDNRKQAFLQLQRGGGIMNRTANAYRARSNDLAQFHKADIARAVVHDLAERLHRSARQMLEEARLWERVLATAPAEYGGAYALVVRGQTEVESDRERAKNAARWVIGDQERNDHYLTGRYETYTGAKTQASLADVLSKMEWRVNKVDGSNELRIDFAFAGGQPWSRVAGQRGELPAGERNITALLNQCRAPFQRAWTDLNVADYLYENFAANGDRVAELAQRVFENTDYLLALALPKREPTARTTFVRVSQTNMRPEVESFLRQLRAEASTRFGDTTDAAQRIEAERRAALARGEEPPTEDYVSDRGQPSQDPFKLSFLIFGDLLESRDVAAFEDSRRDYHAFSGAGSEWHELHVLPAETHALEIEHEPQENHRRREFDAEVVTVMEKMDNFRLAMRALAYGENDFYWNLGDRTGLLLDRYTPPQDNPNGFSYWRLVLMPQGDVQNGRVYDDKGQLALPAEYQLSSMVLDPSLLDAFIQLVGLERDKESGAPIPWLRVEQTVNQAMAWHRDQWPDLAQLGWQLRPNKDRRLTDELKDKAAQTVRLSALIRTLDEQMQAHPWVWSTRASDPPAEIAGRREHVEAVRKRVDLLAALRGAAQQELVALRQRMGQIGVQTGIVPTERRDLGNPVGSMPAEEPAAGASEPAPASVSTTTTTLPDPRRTPVEAMGTPAPVAPPRTTAALPLDSADGEGWTCTNGHANLAEDMYCGMCREPRPQAPGLASTPAASAVATDTAAPPLMADPRRAVQDVPPAQENAGVAAESTGGSALVVRLRELAELKAQGILTDEEFQLAKERVLRGQ